MVYHSAQKSALFDMPHLIPVKTCVKIQPTYAVVYRQPLTELPSKLVKVPVLNKHDGSVSNKAATRIRNAVNWMLFLSKKKKVYSSKERTTFSFLLNFITLTLPSRQMHSDDFIKENMLVPFLEWMHRSHGNAMYVWKCESQINGNIHFHITAHTFIHWRSVAKKWNVLLNRYGYCKLLKDGSNDKGNAATQIKAAKNAEQVGGYLANYISKNDNIKYYIKRPRGFPLPIKTTKFSDTWFNYHYGYGSPVKRPINGRLWGCSYNLSRIDVCFDEEEEKSSTFYDWYSETVNLCEKQKDEKYYSILLYRHLRYKKLPSNIIYLLKHHLPEIKEKINYVVPSLFDKSTTSIHID